MNGPTKISDEINYRKVYLSDLKAALNIYKMAKSTDIQPLADEELTTQFGLPLAIAECGNEMIGFTSAKINDLKEIEFISYYKNGTGQTEIHPNLEQTAKNTFNSTFNTGPGAEKKLRDAAHILIDWLNKCS